MINEDEFSEAVANIVEQLMTNDNVYCVLFGLMDKEKQEKGSYIFKAGSSVLYRHELDLSNIIELTTIVYYAIRNMDAQNNEYISSYIVIMDKDAAETHGILRTSLYVSSKSLH